MGYASLDERTIARGVRMRREVLEAFAAERWRRSRVMSSAAIAPAAPRSSQSAFGRSSSRDRSAAKMRYQIGAESGDIATDNLKPRRKRASRSDASAGISTTGELSPICDSISGRLTAVTSPLT